MLKSFLQKEDGFTFVEMLIIVVIISFLATFVVVRVNAVREHARDTQRTDDIYQIVSALEMYFNDNGYYPGLNSAGVLNSGEFIGDNNGPIEQALRPYIGGRVPKDPLHDGVNYYYAYDPWHDIAREGDCFNVVGDGAFVAIRRVETDSFEKRKDTCTGADMNIHISDFNYHVGPRGF